MKPGEPVSLKELLDPKPPARADMVESVPLVEMPPVEAPQLMLRAGDQGFPGRTLDDVGYMAPPTTSALLPRWISVASWAFALLNLSALVLWLLATFFDIHLL